MLPNIVTAAEEQANYECLMVHLAKTKLPGFHASKIDLLLTSSLGFLSSNVPDAFVTRLGKVNSNLYGN